SLVNTVLASHAAGGARYQPYIARPSHPRRRGMNTLFAPGAKRNRLLLAIGLTLLLVSPAMLLWASRRMDTGTWTDAAIDAEIMRQEAVLLQRATLPPTTERPAEVSPFGAAFPGPRLKDGDRSGMLSTA